MNVIIYLRKSREDATIEERTGEDVLSAHRKRLVTLCKELKTKYIIKQEVVSGDTIAGRPVFQEVLYKLIPSGKYEAIVVNDITRLGRGNMKDAGEIYQSIIEHNIKIITPHRTYNPQNRSDLRQIRFELFLSREEYESIRDRLQDGKDAAARAGRAPNNIYVLGLDTVRGKFVINEEEMKLVKQIFEMYVAGQSLNDIAQQLNRAGYKTKRNKPFTATSVRCIIKNHHYEGYLKWRGELIKAQHGVLIPLELIYKAREKLITRDTHSTIKNKQFWVPLFCGACGSRMYGENKKAKIELASGEIKEYTYPVYFCYGRYNRSRGLGKPCSTRIRDYKVHNYVLEALNLLVVDGKVRDMAIKQRERRIRELSASAEIESIKEEIRSKTSRLEVVENDYISGKADIDIYNKAKNIINEQIKMLQLRLKELEPRAHIKPKSVEQLIEELRHFLNNLDQYSNQRKYETVSKFTRKIVYDKNFEGEGGIIVDLFLPIY